VLTRPHFQEAATRPHPPSSSHPIIPITRMVARMSYILRWRQTLWAVDIRQWKLGGNATVGKKGEASSAYILTIPGPLSLDS